MERLTYWTSDGLPKLYKGDGRAVHRLAVYEDTGLSPAEVADLARAKAEGRLVRLPCKVDELPKSVFVIEDRACSQCWETHKTIVEPLLKISMLPKIGKTVFLTRAEAEAALAAQETP